MDTKVIEGENCKDFTCEEKEKLTSVYKYRHKYEPNGLTLITVFHDAVYFTCMLLERHEDVRCMALLWPLWTPQTILIIGPTWRSSHLVSKIITYAVCLFQLWNQMQDSKVLGRESEKKRKETAKGNNK